MPRSSARPTQQVEDPGLHGDIERRRGLVGDEQLGVAADRHRDHRPLELTAGELVRVGRRDPRRVGEPDGGEQLARPVLDRRAAAGRRRARAIASAIWPPTVWTGFQAVIGSWNTMPTRPPRLRGAPRRRAPSSSSPPAGSAGDRTSAAAAGARTCAVTDLPDPDSPTSATTRPRAGRGRSRATTRPARPASPREGDGEPADREHGWRHSRCTVTSSARSAGSPGRREARDVEVLDVATMQERVAWCRSAVRRARPP